MSFLFCLALFLPAAYLTMFQRPELPEFSFQNIAFAGNLIKSERSNKPVRPQILVSGSSLTYSLALLEMEKQFGGLKTANIGMNAMKASDLRNILQLFPQETSSAKMICMELAPERVMKYSDAHVCGARKKFFTLYRLYSNGTSPRTLTHLNEILLCRRDGFADRLKAVTNLLKHKQAEKTPLKQIAAEEKQRKLAKKECREREKNVPPPVGVPVPAIGKAWCSGQYDSAEFQAMRDIVRICRERGIFFVAFVSPHWKNYLNLSEHDLEVPPVNEYVALLQEIKREPHCETVIAGHFSVITNEGTDEDYLFDYGHMTETGAKVYTNWLVDQLLESPKTAEALHRNSQIR